MESESKEGDDKDAGIFEDKEQNTFVMKGLNMTCLGRSSFVPIHEAMDISHSLALMKSLPDPASDYPRLPKKKKTPDAELVKLQFEIYNEIGKITRAGKELSGRIRPRK